MYLMSCTLTGKVVPVFLPKIMFKTFSKSQQMHSTKYTSGSYLHSSHASSVFSSGASMSSVCSSMSSAGNSIFCIKLTSSSKISCPVTAENASAISFAVFFGACLLFSCFVFVLNLFHKFGLCCITCLK